MVTRKKNVKNQINTTNQVPRWCFLIWPFIWLHLLSSQPRDDSHHAAFKTYYMPPLDRKHGGCWEPKNRKYYIKKKKKKKAF